MTEENICRVKSYFPSREEVEKIAVELAQEDQSVKADAGKLPLAWVPREIIRNIAAIRGYGVMKYGAVDNWKQVSIARYQQAAFRHWLAYLDDPHGVDDESGLPHLWHCCCNLAFLCELEKENFKR